MCAWRLARDKQPRQITPQLHVSGPPPRRVKYHSVITASKCAIWGKERGGTGTIKDDLGCWGGGRREGNRERILRTTG